ncbi:CIC11C00000000805 [Sungouiella intermedia]|uniref:Protein transport protein Sec61 subunit beta n=1 Tax=Sungouiella intermedia TaxID=45354 RepID=A0A1L0BGL8_9ASCO|nr:CIC11C00000000805 [[Candida] intermedia]
MVCGSIFIVSSSAVAPGGLRAAAKRKNVADKKAKEASQMPLSTRAAGAGGSSATMLKLFTDEAQGLRVDPLVVLFLAVGFIFSVIVLHVLAKITGKFTS